MRRESKLTLCLAVALVLCASPIDFGKQEFERALEARKISPQRYKIQTEVSTDAPESFRILAGRVSGGDIRGLMYGLLEAADQIRARGRLVAVKGSPAMAIRGVRLAVRAEDTGKDWFSSREQWEQFLAMLARSRLNRLNLAFEGTALVNQPVLDALRAISQTALEYGVDLAVSIHPEAVSGTPGGLKALLAACTAVRSVHVQPAAGGAAEHKYAALVAAAEEAGRRVALEFETQDLAPAVEVEAADAGVPLRIPVEYGAPVLPERPGGAEMLWQVAAEGAAGKGQWSDFAFVRKTVQDMIRPGFCGFEIDAPEPPAVEANRRFFLLWGRLSYNPKASDPTTPASTLKKP